MKKLTSFLFLISKMQKKKISSALEEKLMQKLEEKALQKKLESSTSVQDRPNAHSRSARNTRLARKRSTKKPKVVLSPGFHAKHEVNVKSKLSFIVGWDVPLPKVIFQVIPILYWMIPMNPSFPNKGSPPIDGIPLEAKGSQRNLHFLTCMMACKELLNLFFPI